MSNDIDTPAGVIREAWSWFPVWVNYLVIGCLLVGALILAGSQFGWWLSGQAANHQARNTQGGYSNQTTQLQQVDSLNQTLASIGVQIAEAAGNQSAVAALDTQQAATANNICADAAQVTDGGLSAGQVQWDSANCTNGALSTTSKYYASNQGE